MNGIAAIVARRTGRHDMRTVSLTVRRGRSVQLGTTTHDIDHAASTNTPPARTSNQRPPTTWLSATPIDTPSPPATAPHLASRTLVATSRSLLGTRLGSNAYLAAVNALLPMSNVNAHTKNPIVSSVSARPMQHAARSTLLHTPNHRGPRPTRSRAGPSTRASTAIGSIVITR